MDLEIQRILVNAGCTIIGALIATITTAIVNHKRNKTKNNTDVIKNVEESVVALQHTMKISQTYTKEKISELTEENRSLSNKNDRLEKELIDIKKELKALSAVKCFNYSCAYRIKELPEIDCKVNNKKK